MDTFDYRVRYVNSIVIGHIAAASLVLVALLHHVQLAAWAGIASYVIAFVCNFLVASRLTQALYWVTVALVLAGWLELLWVEGFFTV